MSKRPACLLGWILCKTSAAAYFDTPSAGARKSRRTRRRGGFSVLFQLCGIWRIRCAAMHAQCQSGPHACLNGFCAKQAPPRISMLQAPVHTKAAAPEGAAAFLCFSSCAEFGAFGARRGASNVKAARMPAWMDFAQNRRRRVFRCARRRCTQRPPRPKTRRLFFAFSVVRNLIAFGARRGAPNVKAPRMPAWMDFAQNRRRRVFRYAKRRCAQKPPNQAWLAATAQATVMPTMGLLPAPIRPIISTCAGTEDEPANWASPCMRPMESVKP